MPKKYSVTSRKDGIIRLDEQTVPTDKSTAAMAEEVLLLAKNLPRPRRSIVNLTGVEVPSSAARKNLARMFKSSELDKVAIFGSSVTIRVVAKFIMAAAGIGNAQFFCYRGGGVGVAEGGLNSDPPAGRAGLSDSRDVWDVEEAGVGMRELGVGRPENGVGI
jgi:anti-anti-sigma regulatory factor